MAGSPLSSERRFLSEIISTVSSSLELEEVLAAIVRLLSEASGVHACFVYLVDEQGEQLVLRAASEPYSQLAGSITLDRGEGLAWWVTERCKPAFIPEKALADPRFKFVPELEEEQFQSLLAVPILARDGFAIGAVLLHTEAPREFSQEEVDFLTSSASLMAGAIENARLYEDARRRVHELEQLAELGEEIAGSETLDDLLPTVAARGAELLGASACHLYLIDLQTEELHRRVSAPADATARDTLKLASLGPEIAGRGRSTRIATPLVANNELLGLLLAEGASEVDLARSVANQTAVAIKKIELIERLTEKNLIKDFFELLAGGAAPGELERRATKLGCSLDQTHLVLVGIPAGDRLERGLAALAPGSVFDRRDDSLRGLIRVPPAGLASVVNEIRRLQADLDPPVAIGISGPCSGASSFPAGFEEARHALLGSTVLKGSPTVMTYEELGPYKYLLRMSLDAGLRDSNRDAVALLAEYDRQRSTALFQTLEEFLRRRGNISATAEALYVHPNTLRQRLRRIMELSGIDLRKDDWLMVEIAVKLVRLEQALGTAAKHTPGTARL